MAENTLSLSLKTLIVDDEAENRKLEKMSLVSHGCKIDEAESGQKGLEFVKNFIENAKNLLKEDQSLAPIFLGILSDFQMPEMNGAEFLQELIKLKVFEREDIKIIFAFFTADPTELKEALTSANIQTDELGIKIYDKRPRNLKEFTTVYQAQVETKSGA